MIIKNQKTYDYLKWIAQVLLPAVGALYFGLAGIWNLPSAEQVVGTIVVVDTFLGVILQISTAQYNNSEAKFDGSLNIEDVAGKRLFSLDLKDDPDYRMAGKDQILFKVNRPGDETGLSLVEGLILLLVVLVIFAIAVPGVFR